MACGRPADSEPIVGAWTQNAAKLWGSRTLRKAIATATEARITTGSLYTLRHSHASACHYTPMTLPEVARRLGHGAELHLRTYAHVIDGMNGERWASLDEMIASARSSLMFPLSSLGTHSGDAD